MTITFNADAAEAARTVHACRMGSPFGEILFGLIEGSVCYLRIGDTAVTAMLERFLHSHGMVRPEIIATELPALIRLELEAYFSGEQRTFSVPVTLFGTELQQRVWNEIRTIPHGETCTYAYLASRIGNKKAVRAVGAAVGSNPVPVIIPCHRVIGSNGDLTGYVFGVEIKERLLVHEGALLA